MTTYPSLALLGRIGWGRFAIATGVGIVFVALSRWTWQRGDPALHQRRRLAGPALDADG